MFIFGFLKEGEYQLGLLSGGSDKVLQTKFALHWRTPKSLEICLRSIKRTSIILQLSQAAVLHLRDRNWEWKLELFDVINFLNEGCGYFKNVSNFGKSWLLPLLLASADSSCCAGGCSFSCSAWGNHPLRSFLDPSSSQTDFHSALLNLLELLSASRLQKRGWEVQLSAVALHLTLSLIWEEGRSQGGVGHSHSLVLSLVTNKSTWQSALPAPGVYNDAKGQGRSAAQGISLGSCKQG